MKKKIAICIRGHIRTWDKCKDNIFQTFKHLESVADVRWFFISWDVQNFPKYYFDVDESLGSIKYSEDSTEFVDTDLSSIENDFQGHHLAQIKCVEFKKERHGAESFMFLSLAASHCIEDYEFHHNVNFDAIAVIRPDVRYKTTTKNILDMCDGIYNSNNHWALNATLNTVGKGRQYVSAVPCPINNRFSAKSEDSWAFQDLIYFGNPGVVNLLHDAYYKNKSRFSSAADIFPHATYGIHCMRYGIPALPILTGPIIIRDINYNGFDFQRDFDADITDINTMYYKLTTNLWYAKEKKNV